MNLHGYLARERIFYGSDEGLDFTNIYFYTVAFHAIRASNRLAQERGQAFDGFEDSKYATGEYFDKYIDEGRGSRRRRASRELFADAGVHIPTQDDWRELGRVGQGARHLQPEPPGRPADRLDLLHQPLDDARSTRSRRRSRSARRARSGASTTRRPS